VKTQVQDSRWAVTACICCILLGDIILEGFDSVCMLVVVGLAKCLQSSPWHQALLFLFRSSHVSLMSSFGHDPRVLGGWRAPHFMVPLSLSCVSVLSGRKKLPCRAITPAMNYGVHLTLMFWRGNRNKKSNKYVWSVDCDEAFLNMKKLLTT
jgi:hypothetical protein